MSKFINHVKMFQNVTSQSKAATSTNYLSVTNADTNFYKAYPITVSEPTTINGFAVQPGSSASALTSFWVAGISTSLGLNGISPYQFSGLPINQSSAGNSIFFEYGIGFTASSNTGMWTFFSFYAVTSSIAYTMYPGNYYYVGLRHDRVTGTGLIDVSAQNIPGNFSGGSPFPAGYQNIGIAVTAITEQIGAIPLFYDSTSNTTTLYNKLPYFTASSSIRYDSLPPSNARMREFGVLFELNDFPVQDFDLQVFKYGFVGARAPDQEFTMNIYEVDNYRTVNVVGTSITIFGSDLGSTGNNGNRLDFIFDPPLRLRADATYFAGVGWSCPTVQPINTNLIHGNTRSGASVSYGPFGVPFFGNPASNQSGLLAYRTEIGTGILITDTPPCRNISPVYAIQASNTTNSFRGIGN